MEETIRNFLSIILALVTSAVTATASPLYYGKLVNLGEVSEAGTDVILYFSGSKVVGHIRNYTNMYGNSYFDLYGFGTPHDATLVLQSVSYKEGAAYEGSPFVLTFSDDSLSIDRLPDMVLEKGGDVLDGLTWLGPLKTEVEIESGVREVMEKRSKPLHIFMEKLLVVDKVKSFSSPVLFDYIEQPNKQGFHLYNCDETVDREEDHDGECKDVFFYYDNDTGGLVLGELAIYKTCLDDSCSHEYHQFLMTKSPGWNVLLHRATERCERGGNIPPCP